MYKTRAAIYREDPDTLRSAKIPQQAGDIIAACLEPEPGETPREYAKNVRDGLLLIAEAHDIVIEPCAQRVVLSEQAIVAARGQADPSKVLAWLRPHLVRKEDEELEDFQLNVQQALRTLALLFEVKL